MLVLASQSPRRREILTALGVAFVVMPSQYTEHNDRALPPEALVRLQAEGKARDVWDHSDHARPVLGADTVVVCGGQILGKPADEEDAARMLRMLSGRRHEVLTGVAVMTARGMVSAAGRTEVEFRTLTEEDIRRYIAGGEPMDKAGAYAIQGEGGRFVESVRGSWSNVVGLPRGLTMELLRRAGVFTGG